MLPEVYIPGPGPCVPGICIFYIYKSTALFPELDVLVIRNNRALCSQSPVFSEPYYYVPGICEQNKNSTMFPGALFPEFVNKTKTALFPGALFPEFVNKTKTALCFPELHVPGMQDLGLC